MIIFTFKFADANGYKICTASNHVAHWTKIGNGFTVIVIES